MKIKEKGTFGYIRQHQILSVLRTVLLFVLALGLYFIGYTRTGSNKNLLTVIAVLGLLPASKSMVNMIMFLRFRSLKKEEHDEYEQHRKELPILYENVLTTSQQAYYLPALICSDNMICSFCESTGDLKVLEAQIKEALKQDGQDTGVKIFQDRRLFMKRLEEVVKNTEQKMPDPDVQSIFNVIKAISL